MGIVEKIQTFFREVKREAKVVKGEEKKDKIYYSKRVFESEDIAIDFFEESRRRLFDVNAWSYIPGALNSTFQLYNSEGENVFKKKPSINDFIRIELPGPFPENWVKVVYLKNESRIAEFTVTPSKDPTESKKVEQVEHFFDKQATSTFRVIRKKNKIYAYEIGKNETPNVSKPEAGNRAVLNTLVSEAGWALFQEIQWKYLTDYLVGKA